MFAFRVHQQVLVKNFKYRVLSYLQTDAYAHDLDSETSLGQYDDYEADDVTPPTYVWL